MAGNVDVRLSSGPFRPTSGLHSRRHSVELEVQLKFDVGEIYKQPSSSRLTSDAIETPSIHLRDTFRRAAIETSIADQPQNIISRAR